MQYVFSGKVGAPKGVNPNFFFNFDHQKDDEAAEKAAKVMIDLELNRYPILEAVLKCGDREVKKYPYIEKKNDILVSV